MPEQKKQRDFTMILANIMIWGGIAIIIIWIVCKLLGWI